MMSKAFSYELGVFDPTFPGISLYFPNQPTWEQSGSFAELLLSVNRTDMLRKTPQMSAEDITTEEVLRYMSKDLKFHVPLGPAEKEQLGKSLIERDPELAVGFLAVVSSHVHERRHFHDWLLSPYTAAMNAQRVEAYFNYAQLTPVLRASDTTVIPVPLTRWIRKTDREQAEHIQMWQSLLGEATEVRVPNLANPDVLSLIENIGRRYKSIGILFEPPFSGLDLDAAALFEASALLVQTQDIHDMLGETAHAIFVKSMVDQDASSRYTWFLRTMNGLSRSDEVLENNTLCSLATWCLLGSTNADPSHANPLTRMSMVVNYLKQCGFPKIDMATDALLTALDRSCGALPYRETLAYSVQLLDTIVDQFEQTATSEQFRSRFSLGVVQTFAYLQACHKYMVNVFLDDPDGYCKPPEYLDRNLEKWPEPPVRYEFGQPFFRVKREDLHKYLHATLFESESTQEDLSLRQFVVPFPEEMMQVHRQAENGAEKFSVDIDIANNWQYLCGLVDTFFAEYNRDKPELEYHREQERKNGRYLLEVFS